MPTREEMIKALREAKGAGPSAPPSREQMIAELRAAKSPTVMGLKAAPNMYEQHDLLGEGLELGARAFDYPRGLLMTGIAGIAGAASGNNPVTKEDVISALKGQAPTGAEYLERLGVDSGPSIPKEVPLIGGTSLRDAEGFALDVGLDPFTLASKTYRALRPVGEVLDRAGTNVYKSGLKNVDKELVENGKKPLADVLLEERATGNMAKLSEESSKISKKLMAERDKIYQQASDAGAIVDMSNITSNARKKLAKLRENPGMRDAADRLEEFLNKYESEGFVDIQSLSDWKTALYDSLPQTAFGPNGKVKGPVKAFEQTLANDFKVAIEKAADDAAPGLGKRISEINEKLGSTISAKKPLAREIRKEVTKNNVTQVDPMIATIGAGIGGAMGGGPGALIGGATAYGAKNAVRAANSTAGRTKGGLLLKDIGSSGLIDSVGRRAVIDYMSSKDKKKKDEKSK